MGGSQELFHCAVNKSIAVKSLCERLPQSLLLGVVYAGRTEGQRNQRSLQAAVDMIPGRDDRIRKMGLPLFFLSHDACGNALRHPIFVTTSEATLEAFRGSCFWNHLVLLLFSGFSHLLVTSACPSALQTGMEMSISTVSSRPLLKFQHM